jgi:hypothetical protein
MNPIITGDPTIDGIIAWLTSGGKLTSPGAILGIGTVIKTGLVPIIARICARFNINFSGPNKLHAVIGCGCGIVGIISFATHQHMTLGDVVLLGTEAGVAAVGIHEGVSTIKNASKAQAANGNSEN